MRIIVKAKPIRIRIKSGGEEHSSLDSLRQNLCVQDLWPLVKDKRLSRWLMQLGEVDLAHAIDALSVGQLDVSTYFKILFLFLKDELYAHCVMDLYTLVSYWHDSEMRMSKNYKSLLKFLLSLKVPNSYLTTILMRFRIVSGGKYFVSSRAMKTLIFCSHKENWHLMALQKVMAQKLRI